VHPSAATLAAQELSQQVLLGWAPGVHDAGAPGADLLHLLEQLVGHDRLVQPLDGTGLVAQPADVAGICGVAEHLPHGVLGELAVAGGACAFRVQPVGEAAVRLVAGGIALEHLPHQRRALRIGDGELAGGVAHVPPWEAADEVSLACLLAQPAAGPEGQRDGVVLVEHLVDGLGEERRWVGVVFAHRLGDGHDTDAESLAEELLVAPGLDLVAREPRCVEHEHHIELAGGGVGHQPLELRAGLGLPPPRVKVAVLADKVEVVLGGELGDRLPLRVGGEPLALLLGGLADIGDRSLLDCLCGATHCVLPGSGWR
jgi:hypothetical protein